MGFKNIGKDIPQQDETIFDRWKMSHYTRVGNVFDTPEHQEALAKLETIDEEIAYKERIMEESEQKIIKKAESS